jgi:hypothetical protein
LGRDGSGLLAAFNDLLLSCEFALDYWHRPNGPDSGNTAWRLSPPRKYSWWFGTTTDMSLLVRSVE